MSSSKTLRAQQDVVKRLTLIRALTLAVNTDPDLTVDAVAHEYHAAILDILEGKSLKQLELHLIKKTRIEQYLLGD